MTNKLKKYGILIIAAVLIVALAFAGVVAAEKTPAQKLADELNKSSPNSALVVDGIVVLQQSITLNNEININGEVTLDLNGSTITAAKDKRLFKVTSKNGNFTLKDSVGGGKLTDGHALSEKKGPAEDANGGAVRVDSDATFIMKSGIINNSVANEKGGAVSVEKKATFIMEGGLITNCTAKNGGGVFVKEDQDSTCIFEMKGGIITGCSATENGGGVYVARNKDHTAVFNVSGTATVKDNTKKGEKNDVYLFKTEKKDGEKIAKLNLVGDFEGSIGIVNPTPVAGGTFGAASGEYNGAENFFADNNPRLVGSIVGSELNWVLTPYVEVSDWGTLKAVVEEWKDTDNMRTVVVMNDIDSTETSPNDSGIEVKGNVTIMPVATATEKITIDAMQMGRLFSVYDNANFMLKGNESVTLELTNGSKTNNFGRGGAIYVHEGTLSLSSGVTIVNSEGDACGGVYIRHDCTFNVGGAVNITGNFNASATNNVYLDKADNGDAQSKDAQLNLIATLTEKIGIVSPVGDDEVFGTIINGATGAENFVSDNLGYVGEASGEDLVWKPIEYTITYDLDDGEFVESENPETYNITSDEITLDANVFKMGYTFNGWYNATAPFVPETLNNTIPAGSVGNKSFWANFTITQTGNTSANNVSEFHNQNLTVLIDEKDKVNGVLLENVSNLIDGVLVTFNASNVSTQISGDIPTTSGYTKITDVTIFEIDVSEPISGEVYINVTVYLENLADKEKVSFWHYNTSAGTWEKPALERKIIAVNETEKKVTYKVTATAFSPFGISLESPSAPTYTPSSSSQSGSTVILPEGQAAPTVAPTAAPTQAPVKPTVSPVSPTAQQTQASPAPIAGLIAGLGIAAALFIRKRS